MIVVDETRRQAGGSDELICAMQSSDFCSYGCRQSIFRPRSSKTELGDGDV